MYSNVQKIGANTLYKCTKYREDFTEEHQTFGYVPQIYSTEIEHNDGISHVNMILRKSNCNKRTKMVWFMC